jgi:hypothetical protein
MQDKTLKEHILSVAQTYVWGRDAYLSHDGARICGCRHEFRSEREHYQVAFTIPATIVAVLDTQEALAEELV